MKNDPAFYVARRRNRFWNPKPFEISEWETVALIKCFEKIVTDISKLCRLSCISFGFVFFLRVRNYFVTYFDAVAFKIP